MNSSYEDAKRKLESILNREWALRDSALDEFLMQVFERNPKYMGKLVLGDLDHVFVYRRIS